MPLSTRVSISRWMTFSWTRSRPRPSFACGLSAPRLTPSARVVSFIWVRVGHRSARLQPASHISTWGALNQVRCSATPMAVPFPDSSCRLLYNPFYDPRESLVSTPVIASGLAQPQRLHSGAFLTTWSRPWGAGRVTLTKLTLGPP